MEYFFHVYLIIWDGALCPFEEGATFRKKQDAETYIKTRKEHWTSMGYVVKEAHLSKKQIRKNYPTFGRDMKKESL